MKHPGPGQDPFAVQYLMNFAYNVTQIATSPGVESPFKMLSTFELDLCTDVTNVECPIEPGSHFSGTATWNGKHRSLSRRSTICCKKGVPVSWIKTNRIVLDEVDELVASCDLTCLRGDRGV